MSNPKLITGIPLRGMVPRIAVPFPNEGTRKLDVNAAKRVYNALGPMDNLGTRSHAAARTPPVDAAG